MLGSWEVKTHAHPLGDSQGNSTAKKKGNNTTKQKTQWKDNITDNKPSRLDRFVGGKAQTKQQRKEREGDQNRMHAQNSNIHFT